MTRDDFTDADRSALCFGANQAEESVRFRRMIQCDAFCNGNDETAARYDGPDGLVASAERHLAAFERMIEMAFRAEVTS